MDQYTVTGMSCAACQARVEKAVSKVPGVTSCNVSLLTNTLGVEGTASASDIMQAVENAGYGASPKGAESARSAGSLTAKIAAEEEALKDHETPVLKKRLIASLGFLLVLMYFSMGHMMFGWPLPAFFDGNHVAMGIVQMLLAGIVMVINQKFFISGFKSLFHGAPNMDTLIAMGSGAAFVYSTIMLLAMTRAQVDGNHEAVMRYMMEFYFESAAMILTLITVGKMLEARSKGRTTDALKSLMKLAPKTANVERNGVEETIDIDLVQKGDIFVVRPGETIPVDGVVIEGESAVNEAALTGESIPVDKEPGSPVSSATLNQSGFLRCQATRVGEGCGGHKGSHCQNSGHHFRRFCSGSHRDRDRRDPDLAPDREGAGRHSACAGHFGPRCQLSLRAWPRDTGGDHGRQRNGRQTRYSLQDSGSAAGDRKRADRGAGQDRHDHQRASCCDGSDPCRRR